MASCEWLREIGSAEATVFLLGVRPWLRAVNVLWIPLDTRGASSVDLGAASIHRAFSCSLQRVISGLVWP